MWKKYAEKMLANITSREFEGFLIAVVILLATWANELWSESPNLELIKAAMETFRWTFAVYAGILTVQKIGKVDKKTNESSQTDK